MKNKPKQNRQSIEKISPTKKDKKEHSTHKSTEKSKKNNITSQEKMVIIVGENVQKELEQEKKKPKVKIFNNKKNNGICSALLKSTFNQEKELIMLHMQKKNKK